MGFTLYKYSRKTNVLPKRNIKVSNKPKTGTNCLDSEGCTTRNSEVHYYAEVEESNILESQLQEQNKQKSIITRDDNHDTQRSSQTEDKVIFTPELHSI